MSRDEELDLVILDELAAGPQPLDDLEQRCNLDAGGLLDRFAAEPRRGEEALELFLEQIGKPAESPERFAIRVEALVERGLIQLGDDRCYALTAAGVRFREFE